MFISHFTEKAFPEVNSIIYGIRGFNHDNFKHEEIHAHNTRNKSLFSLPTAKTNWGKSRSAYMFFNEWNSLNGSLKTSLNFRIFKKQYFNNI